MLYHPRDSLVKIKKYFLTITWDLLNVPYNYYISRRRRQYFNGIRPFYQESFVEAGEFFCHNCDTTENIELHHRIPIEWGGSNHIDNIIPVCGTCHDKIHRKLEIQTRKERMDNANWHKQRWTDEYE